MLREQVLQAWTNCKKKFLTCQPITLSQKEKQLCEFLVNNDTTLPRFPLGIERCRDNLDYWTSEEYCLKYFQEKQKILAQEEELGEEISEDLSMLLFLYLQKYSLFEELTIGWWKEKKEREELGGGPLIEEVD